MAGSVRKLPPCRTRLSWASVDLLETGAFILFSSTDDPEKRKSEEWNYVWMEEGTEFGWDDYRMITTRSTHWLRKWPNLIKAMAISKPGQVWVSDITYFKTGKEGYVYITLITDAYSHKIMGHHLSTDLETASCIQALHMAVHNEGKVTKGLIHHSDRGVQYCSNAYVELLQEHGIAISMTENGDPLENAIAERINGILKQEYLDQWNLTTMAETVVALDRAVLLYNSDRPHNSIANHTPDEAHKGPGGLTRLWKNYYPQRPAVNPEQDIVRPVNLSSDTTLNL